MRLFPILYSFIITFFLTKHKCFTAFSLSVYRFFSHIKRAVFPRPFHSSCPSCSAFSPSLRLIPFGDLFFFRQFAPPFSSLSPSARASFSFLYSPILFFLVLAFFLSALLSSPVLAFPVSPLSVPDLFSLFRPPLLSLSARFSSCTRFIFFYFPVILFFPACSFFRPIIFCPFRKNTKPLFLSSLCHTGRCWYFSRPHLSPFKTNAP